MLTRGIIYLGSKYDSSMLRHSARAQCVIYAFFGCFVIASIFSNLLGIASQPILNAAIGLSMASLVIAELFVTWAVIKLYPKLGLTGIAPLMLPFWPAVMWYGWPIMLLSLPMTYLLYRESVT
jgi:hypothetical protein